MNISRRHFAALLAALTGCARNSNSTSSPQRVVVYTALDQQFSEPLFKPFEQSTGVKVLAHFDTEATKTVGLANRLRVESQSGRVQCDVFWNNEILNTLRLRAEGLLRSIAPPNAEQFSAQFRAGDGTWFGFAARARVLIVNNDLIAERDRPNRLWQLVESRWKNKLGIAKPLFGTTATHAACLFATLGPDPAEEFFRKLKDNQVQILSGNKQVAVRVGNGSLAMGLTDTDDCMDELEKGQPISIVYLDREPGQLGTLFIPNTVAVMKGSPNPAAADDFADYLLSPEVESALALGPSAQIPLNPSVEVPVRVETPDTVHAMRVDWNEALGQWDRTARFIAQHFIGV